MSLKAIEEQLATSMRRLNLRPSLNQAADIGDLLLSAKKLLGHGKFLVWLKKQGVHKRTASDYTTIAIHRSKSKERLDSHLTLKQFFEILRATRRKSLKSLREEERNEIANLPGTPPPSLTLAHADCKSYKFPKNLDCITADPPWNDMEAYKWVNGFALDHLKPGGLLFVQAGTQYLQQVFAAITLDYQWTLAMVLPRVATIIPSNNIRFIAYWRPIIVFSKGKRVLEQSPNDVEQVKPDGEDGKKWHEWEQPLKPWLYWLSCCLKPGEIVADPFAGGATIAEVAFRLKLRYVGTEINKLNYDVARARLAGLTKEE